MSFFSLPGRFAVPHNEVVLSIKHVRHCAVCILLFTVNLDVFLTRALQALSDPYCQSTCLCACLSVCYCVGNFLC